MREASFSDAQLTAFAIAVLNVKNVMEDYSRRTLAATNETDRRTSEHEGGNKIVAAVEDEGLRIDAYNSIIDAARHDKALRSRIDELVLNLGRRRA